MGEVMHECSQEVFVEQVGPLLPQGLYLLEQSRELLLDVLSEIVDLAEHPWVAGEEELPEFPLLEDDAEVVIEVLQKGGTGEGVLAQSGYQTEGNVLHVSTEPYLRVIVVVFHQHILCRPYQVIQLLLPKQPPHLLSQLVHSLSDTFPILLFVRVLGSQLILPELLIQKLLPVQNLNLL